MGRAAGERLCVQTAHLPVTCSFSLVEVYSPKPSSPGLSSPCRGPAAVSLLRAAWLRDTLAARTDCCANALRAARRLSCGSLYAARCLLQLHAHAVCCICTLHVVLGVSRGAQEEACKKLVLLGSPRHMHLVLQYYLAPLGACVWHCRSTYRHHWCPLRRGNRCAQWCRRMR